MFRTLINKILLPFIAFCSICFSSCVLFKPLPLEPIHNSDPVQTLDKSNFSKLNGNYEIVSVDTNWERLNYTFTYKYKYVLQESPVKNSYVNLSVLDERHLKATLYENDKKVKSKTIKGKINNNYFEFHKTHISLKYVIIIWAQQTNRIALSYEGDLFLDTNRGAVGFLLIIPIPFSGSSMDTYNLKFRRRK